MNHELTPPALEPMQDQGSSMFWMFRMAWERKALVLLGIIVAAGLGWLYYVRTDPVYRSGATLHVSKHNPEGVLLSGNGQQFALKEDFLTEHLTVLSSPRILDKAGELEVLQDLKTVQSSGSKGSIIRGGLSTRRNEVDAYGFPTNVFEISFEGPHPEECPIIVEAVISTYRDYLSNLYESSGKRTLKLIEEASGALNQGIEDAQDEYLKFRETAPLIYKGRAGENPFSEPVAQLHSEKISLVRQKTRTNTEHDYLRTALKEGNSNPLHLASLIKQETRRIEQSLEKALAPLRMAEALALETKGPNHPDVKRIRKRMEVIRGRRSRPADLESQLDIDSENGGTEDPGSPSSGPKFISEDDARTYVENHIGYLEELSRLLDEQIAATESELRDAENEAKKLANAEWEDQKYLKNIDRKEDLYNTIRNKLEQERIVRQAGGFEVGVLSPPRNGSLVEPNPMTVGAVSFLLGLLGGLALAYLADKTDRSFRSPEDISRRLNLRVIGHLPTLPAQDKKLAVPDSRGVVLDPILCTHYRPRSVFAEAFRGVRTAVYFTAHEKDIQIIQVTSPHVGDGKTTLAANLAVSMAQSGKKVLLIDGDFRRPRQHKIFELPSKVGLASIIAGDAKMSEAVLPGGIPGLWVLPCGPIPSNPAELLTSARFKQTLDAARKQFDFIIIDTPPVLVVTDPAVVAPRVDGVILTLKVTKHGRSHAESAKETLVALGAHMLGVVVNGVDLKGRSYDYKYYRYSYAYGKKYRGYESYYKSSNENGYFAEKRKEESAIAE